MKILVTGANGQLATEISQQKNSAVDIISYTHKECDICDIHSIMQLIKTHQPDWLVNCAAYTAVDLAEQNQEQAFATNEQGVQNLAIACKKYNIPLLHISTDYVFSGEQQQPYVEHDDCQPLSVYGKSKLAGEQALQATWVKHIIFRTGWVYGHYGKNFMKTMCRLAQQQSELTVVSDQYGGPTSTIDITRAIMTIINASEHQWGIYHFANQGKTNWYDFAKAIIKLDAIKQQYTMPILTPVTTKEFPTAATRPKNTLLNCAKIQKNFGIIAQPWQQALAEVLG